MPVCEKCKQYVNNVFLFNNQWVCKECGYPLLKMRDMKYYELERNRRRDEIR